VGRTVTPFVLGGSPCSGKSSIASSLVRDYGLELYACDAFEIPHVQRSSLDAQPTLYSARALDLAQHFRRDPEDLLEFELKFYREEWTFILEDLKDKTGPMLLEGAACMPELVPLEWPAVWLVPTPDFQRYHYAQRPWIQGVLEGAPNPDVAFEHWMARDELFAQHVIAQCKRLNRPFLVVEGSQTLNQTLEWTRKALNFSNFPRVHFLKPLSLVREQDMEDAT
jgi:hypothetical protein